MSATTLISIFLHGFFWIVGWMLLWKIREFKRSSTEHSSLTITVIIPARNEEHRIGPLLTSLQHQTHPAHEVIVVDDHSDDQTAHVVERAGFRVLPSKPLEKGWLGKPWACSQAAQDSTSELLLFIDADVVLEPTALETLENEYSASRGVISVLPHHIPGSWVEELSALFNIIQLMSSGDFTLFKRSPTTARPFGPILMCSRFDYDRIGGHQCVKDKVVENFYLAQHFHNLNIPIRCYGGAGLAWYRMYSAGFKSVMNGWTKSFAQGAKGTPFPLLFGIILWCSGALGTARHWMVSIISGDLFRILFLTVLYLLYVGQIAWMLRKAGQFRFLTSLLFPVPFVFFVWVFLRSLLYPWIKRPQWKGRTLS